jgi:hypothetical protein
MAGNGVLVRVALVAAAVAVVLVAFAYLPKPAPTPLATADAERLALNDARNSYPAAELRVLDSSDLGGGRWKVRVKVALAAHTYCPSVRVREYELLPIFFREEEVVKDCRAATGPIVYEEEALLRSLEFPAARDAAQRGQYGCALRSSALPGLPAECSAAGSLLASLAARAPETAWLVAWVPRPIPLGDELLGVALDSTGRVLLAERAAA